MTGLIPQLIQSSYDAISDTANDGFVDMEKAGVEMIHFDTANLALVQKAYETVYSTWVTDKTKLGLPAQTVMDKYRELGAQYQSISKYK